MTSPRTAQRLTRILAMLPWVIAHPGATVAEVCCCICRSLAAPRAT